NPDDAFELGALVETTKGMAQAAEIYGAPFVSGKDSFYNYFKTDEGPISIPCTLLVSGFGVVEDAAHVVGSSLRKVGSKLCLVGQLSSGLAGSVFARMVMQGSEDPEEDGLVFPNAPEFDEQTAFATYKSYYELVKKGGVLSAHDISEGGLAVTLSEMAFSGKGGITVNLGDIPTTEELQPAEYLFGETPGCLVIEVAPEHVALAESLGFPVIGESTAGSQLVITDDETTFINASIPELKTLWQHGLTPYY
ncbi:MAG: AIR synthase-related protein, partial [Verrucomicrobium sp.]